MKRRLTVVENADDCLIDATELYAEVDWSIEALGKQIRLVDTCLHGRRCIMELHDTAGKVLCIQL